MTAPDTIPALTRDIVEHHGALMNPDLRLRKLPSPEAVVSMERRAPWLTAFAKQANARMQGEVAELLAAAHRRQRSSLHAIAEQRGWLMLEMDMELLEGERLAIGLGAPGPLETTGVAMDRALGVPHLPGSSLRGVVHSFARERAAAAEEGMVKELFDGAHGRSVVFADALPAVNEGSRGQPPRAWVRLEVDVVTPHYGPYYSQGQPPGDYYLPTPITFLVVAPLSRFWVRLCAPRARAAAMEQWCVGALTERGAGAKTRVGNYGRFRKV